MEGNKKPYFRKVDNKGRLFIPKALRAELKKELVLTAGFEGELYLYNQKDESGIKEVFLKLKNFAERIELDSQGRILIPRNHLSYALINADDEFRGEVMIKEIPLLDFYLLKIMSKKREGIQEEIEELAGNKAYRTSLLEGGSLSSGASRLFIKDMLRLLLEFEFMYTQEEIFKLIEEENKFIDELMPKLLEIETKKERGATAEAKLDKYTELVQIYSACGNFEKLKKIYAKLASSDSKKSTLNDLGNALFNLGEYEAAKEKFLAILEKDESCLLSQYNLGMTYAKLDDIPEAIDIHKKIFQNTPEPYILFTTFENMAASVGLRKAENYFTISVGCKPGLESKLMGLERLLSFCPPYAVEIIGERWISKKALAKIRKLLKEGNDAVAYSDAGNFYYENGLFDVALDHFKESVNIEPDNPDYLTIYALALAANGRFKDALKHLEKASSIQPEYRGTIFFKGLVYGRTGQHAKAHDEYRKALNIPSKDDFIKC